MSTASILKLGEERRDGECGAKGQLVTQWHCYHHQELLVPSLAHEPLQSPCQESELIFQVL